MDHGEFKDTQLEHIVRAGVNIKVMRTAERLHRPCGQHRRRDGCAVQSVAAGKCDGQLRQGCPARAREDRARSRAGSEHLLPRHVGHTNCLHAAKRGNGEHPEPFGFLNAAGSARFALIVVMLNSLHQPVAHRGLLMFATFMEEVLDTTVVKRVASTHRRQPFSVDRRSHLALTSYLVANAITCP